MFRSLKFAGAKLANAGEHLKRGVLSLVWPETSPSSRNKGVFTLSSIPRPFTIRLAKAQDDPHILHFIRENFYCQEPLLKSLKVTKSMASPCLESRLCDNLKDGFTMIAVENKDNRIVGVAVNQRNCIWDGDLLKNKADSVKCESLRKLFYIWSIVSTEPKLHQKFNTDCIFEIAILATAREAQGQGIGYQLTVHSLNLARDLGFEVARMDCTSEYSSRLAQRAGMECIWSVPYKHLVDNAKKPVVKPEVPHTHIRVHATQLKPATTTSTRTKTTTKGST